MRMGKIEESIADLEKAKKIAPAYLQAYIYHSKALAYKNKMGASYEMLKQAWLKDKNNQSLKAELDQLEQEIKMDQLMPKDHPNRLKMQRYLDWLRGNGAVFSQKLRLRSESDKDWEVIAMRDIERGEAILKIPEKFVMTYEKVQDIPANSWLNWNPDVAAKLKNKRSNALALWFLHEKKKAKSKMAKYFETLP